MYTYGWPQKKLITVLSPFPQSRLLQWSAGGYWNEQHHSLSGYWIHFLQTNSFLWPTLSQPKACHALHRNIARSGRGLQHVLDATKHVLSVGGLNITELKLFVSKLRNVESHNSVSSSSQNCLHVSRKLTASLAKTIHPSVQLTQQPLKADLENTLRESPTARTSSPKQKNPKNPRERDPCKRSQGAYMPELDGTYQETKRRLTWTVYTTPLMTFTTDLGLSIPLSMFELCEAGKTSF